MEAEAQPSTRVSVLLLSRNQGPALKRAIQALEQAKNRAELQLIVLDCGSADDSGSIDQEFPDVTVLRMPKHFGATRAYNIGIRTAQGEFLLFLDPQIELAPEAPGAMLDRFAADAEAGAVSVLVRTADGKVVSRVSPLPGPGDLNSLARNGGMPAPFDQFEVEAVTVEYAGWSALLVRKNFIQALNFLDARFGHFGADLDLCAQLRRSGKKIRLLTRLGATWHPLDRDVTETGAERGLLAADRALGAIEFVAKYHGAMTGLRMRIATIFWTLGRFLGSLVKAKDISFEFNRFKAVLAGQKIDGSQA